MAVGGTPLPHRGHASSLAMLCVERGRATSRRPPAVPVGLWLFKKLLFRALFLKSSFSKICLRRARNSRWLDVAARCYTTRVPPRLAVRCALFSVDGGVGLFSWLNSTFRSFCAACGPSTGPVHHSRPPAPSTGPVRRPRPPAPPRPRRRFAVHLAALAGPEAGLSVWVFLRAVKTR